MDYEITPERKNILRQEDLLSLRPVQGVEKLRVLHTNLENWQSLNLIE